MAGRAKPLAAERHDRRLGPADVEPDAGVEPDVDDEVVVDPSEPVDASCRKPFVVDGRRVSLAEYVAWERKQRRDAALEELRTVPVPPTAPKE